MTAHHLEVPPMGQGRYVEKLEARANQLFAPFTYLAGNGKSSKMSQVFKQLFDEFVMGGYNGFSWASGSKLKYGSISPHRCIVDDENRPVAAFYVYGSSGKLSDRPGFRRSDTFWKMVGRSTGLREFEPQCKTIAVTRHHSNSDPVVAKFLNNYNHPMDSIVLLTSKKELDAIFESLARLIFGRRKI